MAKFRQHTLQRTDSLLRESFKAITSLDGINKIYDTDQQQGTALALKNADDRIREISDEISKLYKKLEYGIKIDSGKHLEDFNRFSTLLLQAMKINDLLSGDDIILSKLADILTYAYAKLAANRDFQIYSDFDTAKKATSIIFATAKKLGLKFFQTDLEDLIQKILLSVLYKETSKKPEKKEEPKKPEKKAPEKAPEQPAAAPAPDINTPPTPDEGQNGANGQL